MKNTIYGAICGDIIGKPYEFIMPRMKDVNFDLYNEECIYTDDTVMSVAVAKALLVAGNKSEKKYKKELIKQMHIFGNNHINAGYGGMFYWWIETKNKKPYNSFGNGSAMRISPVGLFFDTLEDTLKVAKWTSEITHDHPEGIKGAQSVAAVMWLNRNGYDKKYIKDYIKENFGYNLDRSCDDIRPEYKFDVTCQGSVPESIIAFLEGNTYEECIRLAISLGGDTDTQGAITGAMACTIYGIDDEILNFCKEKLSKDLYDICAEFDKTISI